MLPKLTCTRCNLRDNTPISWSKIEETYNYDKQMKCRMLPKLTDTRYNHRLTNFSLDNTPISWYIIEQTYNYDKVGENIAPQKKVWEK